MRSRAGGREPLALQAPLAPTLHVLVGACPAGTGERANAWTDRIVDAIASLRPRVVWSTSPDRLARDPNAMARILRALAGSGPGARLASMVGQAAYLPRSS